MADTPTDAALLAAARAGDDDAFGLLTGRYARKAYVAAWGVVGDADLAEDVCQDALFRAWQRLGDCRDPDRFGAWLLQVVRRHAINAVRRRGHERLGDAEVAAPGPSPEGRAVAGDEAARLAAALARLPQVQRGAVLMFDLEGQSHREIAETLGTSEAMSRQYLLRGRRRLREILGPEES